MNYEKSRASPCFFDATDMFRLKSSVAQAVGLRRVLKFETVDEPDHGLGQRALVHASSE